MRRAVQSGALFALIFGLVTAAAPAQTATTPKDKDAKPKTLSDQFEGVEFRTIGPFRGGRVTAVAGVRHEPQHLLLRRDRRRRLEDDRRRLELGGRLRQGLQDGLGRRDRASRSPTRTSSTSGWARRRSAATSRTATASTSRPTPGSTWKNVGLEGHAPDRARARASEEPRPRLRRGARATSGARTRSAASSARRTAARPGRRSSSSTTRRARRTSRWIPTTRASSTPAFWQVVRQPWELVSRRPGQRPLEVDRRRRHLEEADRRACRRASSGKRRRRGLAGAARPRLRDRRGEDRAASSAATTAARSGRTSTTSTRSASAPGTTRGSIPDPKNAGRRLRPERPACTSRPTAARPSRPCRVPHGDNHDLWIDPDDPTRMIVGNDGGATITFNGGRTWSTQDNQPTAQFYRVTTDNRFPYWVYGAQQDNSTVAIPSGVPGAAIGVDRLARRRRRRERLDRGRSRRTPTSSTPASTAGSITRYDHRTRQARDVMAWPQLADGHATKDLKYRFQWNAPIVISPHDPKALYHASQILLRSRDEGRDVGGDLAGPDAQRQGEAGQVRRADHEGQHRRRGLRHDLRARASRRPSRA